MSDSQSMGFRFSVVVPWLLTIATAAVGVWQFTAQQQQLNRQPFLQKQLELCFQASETAGRLASQTNPVEWEKARLEFWHLYWGPLSIVEDRAVQAAMVNLGHKVPKYPVTAPELPMLELGGPSYRLALAVRDLVLTSWQVNLPALDEQKSETP